MKKISKVINAVIAILLFATLICAVTTCANAQDVSITVNLYPDNNPSSGNPVVVRLNGKVYTEDIWFDAVVSSQIKLAEDEAFIVSVLTTYQKGTATDVLDLWHPDERVGIRPYAEDPEKFAKTKSYATAIKQAAFLAKIYYGAYEIFLIQISGPSIGNIIKEYSIIKAGGRFYLTNKLRDDPVFLYITTKYEATLPLKVRP